MKDADTDAKPKEAKKEDASAVKKEEGTAGDKAVKEEEVKKKEKTPVPMPEQPQLQLHGKLSTTGNCKGSCHLLVLVNDLDQLSMTGI